MKILQPSPRSSQSPGQTDEKPPGHLYPMPRNSRRRHLRVNLLPLHSVQFQIEGGKAIELGNISISGMGLFTRSLPSTFRKNSLFEGILTCGSQSAKVAAEVVHVGEALTGCQFVGHDVEVSQLIRSYLNLELNALAMIAVKSSLLQEEPEGTPHWIHGKNNCELFYVSEGDRIIRFNLTFFGNYVEGGQGLRPKYGQIVDEDDGWGKPRHKSSTLIRWDATLAAQMQGYAVRFLGIVPHLQESHRKELIHMLEVQ